MTNPFKDSTKKMQRAESNEGLDLAVVEQVDDDERHIVFVRVLSATSEGTVSGEPTPVGVAVPTSGDVNVPSVGDLVVIGRFKGRRPVIIGTVHSQGNAVPTYTAGERVLGHTSTDAQIRFKNDGTIAIDSDGSGDVLINGSSVSGSGYGDEDAQDAVGTILSGDFTYDDATPGINMDPHKADASAHHSRYTDEEAQDAVGTILSGNFTYDDVANTIDLSFDPATQTELDTHAGNASAHHSRYTDAEVLSTVGAKANDVNIGVEDTRDTEEAPTFFDNELSFDFKRTSTIGVPSSGTYCGLLTFAPWGDDSGDKSHQLAFTNDGLFIRSGLPNNASWESWRTIQETKGVVASGQVALSSGSAVVDTGISATDATFMLAIGVDDPNADTKVAGRLFWDDSAGTYKVEIVEQETSVGNPTVNYDVIRVR